MVLYHIWEGTLMKIDRLIGILSVLLQKESATAPELAEKFEVSRRTIQRDIEDLCKAGIPLVTRQGSGGGISIMDNYKMERALLTNAEMQDILAGLRSLDSVSKTNHYARLMEKLCVGSSDFMVGDQSVLIDLSSWYKDALAPKIEKIRLAIAKRNEVEFFYYAPGGEGVRVVEPYYLVFKWSSWYVWGWCKKREDFRLFKLNRMGELKVCGTVFGKRQVPFPDLSDERIFPGGIKVKALFEPDCKWRLVEEFGPCCYEEQEDGRLLFYADYTNRESLLAWLFTFQDKVVLLEPAALRGEIGKILKKMQENYKGRGGVPRDLDRSKK